MALLPIIVSPLSISCENASRVRVLLDSRLVAATHLLAFHPSDSSKTVFVTAAQLKEHLSSTHVKVIEVEFTAVAPGKYESIRHAS